MAVATSGGLPVDSWWSVMLELIMFVVLEDEARMVSVVIALPQEGTGGTHNSVSAAVPAPQHLMCSEMKWIYSGSVERDSRQ